MIRLILLPVLLLSFFCSDVNAQWVPHKGKGLLIIGPRVSWSASYYDANGSAINSINDGQFNKVEIGGYFSIGIGDGYGLFTGFSIADMRYKDTLTKAHSGGFTNPTIGIIKQFTDYPMEILSAQFTVTPPANFPKGETPELGGDFWEFEAGGLVGKGYDRFYLTGQAYYKYKASELKESQLRFVGGGGVSLAPPLDLFAGAEYTYSMNTSLRALKVSGTLLYKFDPTFGLGLGGEYILSGTNVSIGPLVSASLWYSF
jgi:hypothetical protein